MKTKTNSNQKKKRMKEPIIDKVRKEKTEIFSERFSICLNKLIEQGYTQAKIATNLGVVPSVITKYKKGEIYPELIKFFAMEELFGVSANYLMGRIETTKDNCNDINMKIGISQPAIETLYRIQHEYFELEKNFEVNIEEERNISKTYQEELKILSLIIEDNINLIELLHSIKEYKNKKQELQTLIKSYKKTKDEYTYLKIREIATERKQLKFNAMETFSNIIEDISKGENNN